MSLANMQIYLLQRIAEDDQEAYKELFHLYYDSLFRFALTITKSRELAEETVNDVFIKVWRNRESATTIQNIQLYLYKAVRNTALNYLSRLTKQPVTSLDEIDFEAEYPFENPEEQLITREMNKKLQSAINNLPARCKLIFKLVKEDGLSYRDTAELLNISESTVDNQLVIAVKRISAAMVYTFKKEKK